MNIDHVKFDDDYIDNPTKIKLVNRLLVGLVETHRASNNVEGLLQIARLSVEQGSRTPFICVNKNAPKDNALIMFTPPSDFWAKVAARLEH